MIKVGQKLKDARLEKNLNLREISDATKIREEFLEAIEKGEYEKLPGPSYAHGFVRNYSKYLGLPEEETLAIFRREFDTKAAYEVLPKGLLGGREFSIKRLRPNRSFILATFSILILFLFILYQYRFAFLNPSLQVFEPKKDQVITTLSVKISGKTNPDSTVFVGNEAVSLEKDGSFEKTVTFFPGKTTITIKTVNRFGKETIQEIPVTIKPGP